MSFYSSKKQLADKLISKYGMQATIKDAVSLVKKDTVYCIRGKLNKFKLPDQWIDVVDSKLILTHNTYTPTTNDIILFDNITYSIVDVETVRPTDTTILHNILVRV